MSNSWGMPASPKAVEQHAELVHRPLADLVDGLLGERVEGDLVGHLHLLDQLVDPLLVGRGHDHGGALPDVGHAGAAHQLLEHGPELGRPLVQVVLDLLAVLVERPDSPRRPRPRRSSSSSSSSSGRRSRRSGDPSGALAAEDAGPDQPVIQQRLVRLVDDSTRATSQSKHRSTPVRYSPPHSGHRLVVVFRASLHASPPRMRLSLAHDRRPTKP